MAQNKVAGPEIERLIQLLAKLPGLGPRSARRAALHLIKKKDQLLAPLSEAMGVAVEKIGICSSCGTVDTTDPCAICSDPKRDSSVLVVVEDVADLWALERASATNAIYHVLGGTLSPLDGVGPEDLNIAKLIERCEGGEIQEVILAINATVEGQTTAHFVMDQLAPLNVNVTKLAHGVPVGGELDYLDEGTLTQALKGRTRF
ncbi:DNA replication and repair protein RecR [Roseibium hamelinense]|uniref:Recombination protein RecR n=1 Tax=Roseibium hamelinense TaxID=150831 RepID=A0A562T385_9HYPH|nr:recombination mediator RecR [Roseibium hamelinense]MTI44633.1 recombination protein RecR [Roseibium hamelinense]TWI87260.1 DNA replication and repair protein RecR [Roseibium hamelinense]